MHKSALSKNMSYTPTFPADKICSKFYFNKIKTVGIIAQEISRRQTHWWKVSKHSTTLWAYKKLRREYHLTYTKILWWHWNVKNKTTHKIIKRCQSLSPLKKRCYWSFHLNNNICWKGCIRQNLIIFSEICG